MYGDAMNMQDFITGTCSCNTFLDNGRETGGSEQLLLLYNLHYPFQTQLT
jgi:hypothetical protein